MRGAAADAVFIGSLLECFYYDWMICESKIIIAAKRDNAPAIDDPLRFLWPCGDATRAIKLFGTAFFQG
jgi:hypothetical protein